MSSRTRAAIAQWWTLPVVLAVAFLCVFTTPWSASDLIIAPDSVEYAIAPAQLLETGRYSLVIEGRELPPRYPPWFSAFVILPVYLVLGTEPGNAIIGVTALAVAGIAFAWLIGRRISGTSGGVLAALAVLAIPTYGTWAKHVMSDVPAVAVMLGTWLLYLHIRSTNARPALFFAAGCLVAATALVRPVFGAMLLPFLWAALGPWGTMLRRAIALGIPMIAAAAATFAYNHATFGSVTRNGYNLWVPVPCDYASLAFSVSYVSVNVQSIIATALPLIAAAAGGLALALRFVKTAAAPAPDQQLALRESLLFLGLTTAPMLLFHLIYFFPCDRFHLPLMAGTAIIAGALAGRLLGPGRENLLKLALPALLLFAVWFAWTTPSPLPHQRLATERIKAVTENDAVVISAINPVYLERLSAYGSQRQIVPLSRRVEYASKLLAWKKVENPQPPPRHWTDTRAEGLRRGGAVEAVRFVASEQLHVLEAAAGDGKQIYLDISAIDARDHQLLGEIERRFQIVKRASFLYQLKAR